MAFTGSDAPEEPVDFAVAARSEAKCLELPSTATDPREHTLLAGSLRFRDGSWGRGSASDLLNRNFAATAPNQPWAEDVTEFACGDGKLYLAGIRYLFHRCVVGYATSGRQGSALVVSTLTMALARTGHPADVIHHADWPSPVPARRWTSRSRRATPP